MRFDIKLNRRIKKNLVFSAFYALYQNYFSVRKRNFAFFHETAKLRFPALIKGVENVSIFENSHIMGHSKIITTKAKFILKKNSGIAEGLTVITGTHPFKLGSFFIEDAVLDIQIAKDVIVEEDVWIGTNVTLLPGVTVGRGAIVGSGSVCRDNIPPYSIVHGNFAKVIGFKFLPLEIITHEINLYSESERLELSILEKNYSNYFVKRIDEIKKIIK